MHDVIRVRVAERLHQPLSVVDTMPESDVRLLLEVWKADSVIAEEKQRKAEQAARRRRRH